MTGKVIEHPSLSKLTKVIFDLSADSWHGYAREAVWAKPLADGTYELQNTPFFADGFAYRDVLAVRDVGADRVVSGVVKRSGHSTYRIIVEEQAQPRAQSALRELTSLGCSYESFAGKDWTLYAFDMPAGTPKLAYPILESGLNAGLWDFNEGVYVSQGPS